MFDTLYSRQEQ